MRTLFISQPFTGRDEEAIFEIRERIKEFVENLFQEEFDVIDQYHQDAPVDAGRLFYLGNSIKMMGDADLVVFASDWRDAPGCRVEMSVCLEYGLPYMDMSWL